VWWLVSIDVKESTRYTALGIPTYRARERCPSADRDECGLRYVMQIREDDPFRSVDRGGYTAWRCEISKAYTYAAAAVDGRT